MTLVTEPHAHAAAISAAAAGEIKKKKAVASGKISNVIKRSKRNQPKEI